MRTFNRTNRASILCVCVFLCSRQRVRVWKVKKDNKTNTKNKTSNDIDTHTCKNSRTHTLKKKWQCFCFAMRSLSSSLFCFAASHLTGQICEFVCLSVCVLTILSQINVLNLRVKKIWFLSFEFLCFFFSAHLIRLRKETGLNTSTQNYESKLVRLKTENKRITF